MKKVIFIFVIGLLLISATAVLAASVTPTPIPGASNDGKFCADVLPGTTELKIDDMNGPGPYTASDGVLSVSVVKPSLFNLITLNSLDWTSNIPVVGVIVKDGVDGANFYNYSAAPSLGDTNLITPNNGARDVSHTSWCYYPPQPLDVTKTAAGTYDRTVTWDLDKYVNAAGTELAEYTGFAGDVFNPNWLLYVDKSETLGNYLVAGSITITNPNGYAVPFIVEDYLNDVNNTPATVTCPSDSVPANNSITCSYTTADLGGQYGNLNTVVVTPTWPAIMGDTATESYNWVENLIGVDSGTLTDDRFPAFLHEVTGDADFTLPEPFTCPTDAAMYTNGLYAANFTNTGTLVVDETLTDTAAVKLNCTLPALVPTKTAAGTYDRTVTWDLVKNVNAAGTDLAEYTGFAGDVFNPNWLLFVDKTEVLDNYQVAGAISVYNPAAIAQTFAIEDHLDDGSIATVSCPSLTVAPLATVDCTYTAAATAAATENTVKVTAAGNAPQYDTVGFTYTEHLTGVDSGTLTDDRFPLFSETVNADADFTLPETFTCPTDAAMYTNGLYTANFTNTGTLVVNTTLTDTAAVKLNCSAGFVDLLKLTNGLQDPDMIWNFGLYLGPDGFGTTPIATDSTPPALMDFGMPALRPDKTYTVCELSVMAGWSSEWMLEGATILPYNPDADNVPPEDLGNRCFDFTVTVGATANFQIDNRAPGGDPRTPGYWKNWSSCTGGGQYEKTIPANDPDNDFISLDEVLTSPGIIWDDNLSDSKVVNITTCQNAVAILDQRVVNGTITGKKIASDAARTLAMHLLAAQLNFGAGACTTPEVLAKALEAEVLLDKLNFDGTKTTAYLTSKSADYAYALSLARYLDQYNNGMYCGSLMP